jgi:hypothetical protein
VTDQFAYFESDLDGGLPAGIVLNGDATWIRAGTDGAVRLTSIDYYQVGAALLTDLVPADELVISFRFITGGGDGADGLALGLLDPSTPDTAIGVYGEGLGLYGLTGYAVELDTYTNYPKDPNNNHIALMDTTTLNALVSSSSIPDLDDGVERLLELTKSGDHFTVTLDGATVFTYHPHRLPLQRGACRPLRVYGRADQQPLLRRPHGELPLGWVSLTTILMQTLAKPHDLNLCRRSVDSDVSLA